MSLQFFQLLAQPSVLSEFLHENRTALHAFLGDRFQISGQIQGKSFSHFPTLSRHSGGVMSSRMLSRLRSHRVSDFSADLLQQLVLQLPPSPVPYAKRRATLVYSQPFYLTDVLPRLDDSITLSGVWTTWGRSESLTWTCPPAVQGDGMKKTLMLVVAFLFATSAAWGQSQNTIASVSVVKPKPGSVQQFEAARKQHSAWHKAKKDSMSVLIWEILTGDNEGAYLSGNLGQQWKDFDGREQFDKEDAADRAKSLDTFSAPVGGSSFWVYRSDLSASAEPATPSKYMVVTDYVLKPEHIDHFIATIKKINAGLKKVEYPASTSRWYSLANGGQGPVYALVTERASYAEMAPPAKTMSAALDEAYGAGQGDAIINELRNCYTATRSYMAQYRPDLSFVAPK
jgi:hypothetical protein